MLLHSKLLMMSCLICRSQLVNLEDFYRDVCRWTLKTTAFIKLSINDNILKKIQYWLGSCTRTYTAGKSVFACVCGFVHVRTLCSRGARLYVMSRDEITVDWLSHTVHSVSLWTHTCGCWGIKHTHNQRHTHTHLLFSQLTGCPLVFLMSFFFYLNKFTSWAFVWHCMCWCVRTS